MPSILAFCGLEASSRVKPAPTVSVYVGAGLTRDAFDCVIRDVDA